MNFSSRFNNLQRRGVPGSVIMGLGVTHILAGVSKTIYHRKTVKLYRVQTLWAFNILIFTVGYLSATTLAQTATR